MKITIDNANLYALNSECTVTDVDDLKLEVSAHPDDEIEPRCVLLSAGPVSIEVDAQDLADALLPFLARMGR